GTELSVPPTPPAAVPPCPVLLAPPCPVLLAPASVPVVLCPVLLLPPPMDDAESVLADSVRLPPVDAAAPPAAEEGAAPLAAEVIVTPPELTPSELDEPLLVAPFAPLSEQAK